MHRSVVITGLGPVSGLGLGMEAMWSALLEGRSAVGPVRAFDASSFDSPFACEAPDDFKVRDYVPKSYRKATKVMCRDIELAVASADLAARDAKLITKAIIECDGLEDAAASYEPTRIGAHIGAGLIAADLDELSMALYESRDEEGNFDIRDWGASGIKNLTPLWLLKYLPNMLACHVTILHDTQGPSNTITCCETSASLSIGESLRVIDTDGADVCFCGGMESKVNPMSFLRQMFSGRYVTDRSLSPSEAVRPFDGKASGSVVGEGGGIVILESESTFRKRCEGMDDPPRAYAKVLGFGASMTIDRASRNVSPDAEGVGMASAIRKAIAQSGIEPDAIDLIVPFGCGTPSYDRAEAAALKKVFNEALEGIRVAPIKSMTGLCGAGTGGLDMCVAARALREQRVPAVINCDEPIEGLNAASGPSEARDLRYVLSISTGLGGQNAAFVLGRADD